MWEDTITVFSIIKSLQEIDNSPAAGHEKATSASHAGSTLELTLLLGCS